LFRASSVMVQLGITVPVLTYPFLSTRLAGGAVELALKPANEGALGRGRPILPACCMTAEEI
jgi:hypothetical protein